MTDKIKCIKCGNKLKWGGFAHHQNTCWCCFKDVALMAVEKLHGEEREIVDWMLTIVADIYGEER